MGTPDPDHDGSLVRWFLWALAGLLVVTGVVIVWGHVAHSETASWFSWVSGF
jgi:hypothetical protein